MGVAPGGGEAGVPDGSMHEMHRHTAVERVADALNGTLDDAACKLNSKWRSTRPNSIWLALKPRSAKAQVRQLWYNVTHANAASG